MELARFAEDLGFERAGLAGRLNVGLPLASRGLLSCLS